MVTTRSPGKKGSKGLVVGLKNSFSDQIISYFQDFQGKQDNKFIWIREEQG
jgi:hypothetical protein